MKKLNESQLIEQARGLRDYLAQIDEAGPYTAGQQAPAAPTGNSFDAKLAQANAAAKAKGGRTGPVATKPAAPDPKGPGARPTGWMARFRGDDARWDTANAAKYNPDGTAKKPAVAKAPAAPKAPQAADPAPAQPGTPAAATSADAAKAAGAAMNAEPAAPAAQTGPWPAGSPQATAWAALSPEDQKWLGGADPTDQMILARAPNGGKPAAAPATGGQGASPAPAPAVPGVKAGGEVVDTRGGAQGQDEMEETGPVPGMPTPATDKAMDVERRLQASWERDHPGEKYNDPNQFGGITSAWDDDERGQQKYINRTKPGIVNTVKDKFGVDKPDPAYAPKVQEESVTFQNDELNRIISLVQHR